MRILHTSDWHLGRTLEGRSRQKEQEQFVEEICCIADEEKVDMVLIAGDVFDTYNPPAHAQELYCRALERLARARKRAVIVIAGNHDSPERLVSVQPLAMRHGVYIAGLPAEVVSQNFSGGGVQLVRSGPGWLEIAVPPLPHSAVVSMLPYPSESRLQEVLSAELQETEIRMAYSQAVHDIFARQAQAYRRDTVNIAVSHLFVMGGLSTDSERPIEVGGACTVDIPHLPEQAQYIALGHLHRPQEVKHAPTKAYYSGSPLAYSFSEAGQSKVVYLVDIVPGKAAEVRPIPLTSGVPLEKWRCLAGIEEAEARLSSVTGKELWIDLEVHSPRFLTSEEAARLRQVHNGIINVRCVVTGAEEYESVESISSLSVPELFVRYYRHRRGGASPSPELTKLFTELANKTAVSSSEEANQ